MIIVLSMFSIVSNFVIYASLILYYTSVIRGICKYMNLPFMGIITNIYCDGIYDILHLGHMNAFKQALSVVKGARLFVGVINDKTAMTYKRAPIMHSEERENTVRACMFVHAVIKDAPLIASKEFIEKHNIHIYAIGEEYKDDEKYYIVPRDMGIIRYTKRSKGVSTSDVIRRIIKLGPDVLKRRNKA